ncbi:MAG: hypothetical protein Q9174_006335 [Haloplaca sp. 1 TL-2023]
MSTAKPTTLNHQEDVSHVLDRIKDALTTADSDSGGHAQLLADISRLQLMVETPLETIYRIGHQTWQNACVRIVLELGVFDLLVAKGADAVSVQELASTCGADMVVLAVVLGLSNTSGIWSRFDIFTPTAAKFPEYMRAREYLNPTDSTASAFAYTNGSEFWDYLKRTPLQSMIFNDFMATRREGRPSWYDIYPVDQELLSPAWAERDRSSEINSDVLLVDVGGNRGHDLVKLKAKFPNLTGRTILQDLPDVVAHASFSPKDNIEAMPHNFFQPQPIQHARAYHFRAIFHDWPDASCRTILSHTAAAMKPGYSKLLISEFVLPDIDTDLFPATLDVQMMGLHAGMERSEGQWRSLLDDAGLRVVKIWQKVKGGEGVIEAVLKT